MFSKREQTAYIPALGYGRAGKTGPRSLRGVLATPQDSMEEFRREIARQIAKARALFQFPSRYN